MESLLIRTIIFTQININNNKKIHHFIQNIHNLYNFSGLYRNSYQEVFFTMGFEKEFYFLYFMIFTR